MKKRHDSDRLPKIEELLITESDHISKLNEIVLDAIEEEKLLSKKLDEFEDRDITYSGKIADTVARFAGSWKFILTFLLVMAVWMIVNSIALIKAFDPFPFILLNLVLSTIAAIQAPIIIMSQNRKEDKDRQRAINDYMVNLKAEIEIRNLHRKLDLLITRQMKTLFDVQNEQVEMIRELKELIKAERDTNRAS